MRSLPWIQAKINANGLIAAAVKDGSIQIVYRNPEVSPDRLSVTWRLSILIIDITIADVIRNALARMGFSVGGDGETLTASQDYLLTTAERREIEREDQKAVEQQKQHEQVLQSQRTNRELEQTAATLSELQEQIQSLREELELMRLMPAAKGRRGEAGQQGPQGLPGRDLLATEAVLSDLKDVSDVRADQGEVLTWDELSQQWEPKSPRLVLSSLGGGGAGAGGGGGALTVGTFGSTAADLGTAVTTLRFDSDSGFAVVAGPNGTTEAHISLNSTFKTWVVPGQTSLVAEGEDTINLTTSNGISLTTSVVGATKTLNIGSTSYFDTVTVDAASVVDKSVLVYDATNSKWVANSDTTTEEIVNGGNF